MAQMLSFASKVSKTKTRTKKDKDYYTFRVNIPKEISDKLELSKDDYLLLKVMKAEWYHLLDWRQMQKTWNKMPEELREKIKSSGLEIPLEFQTLTKRPKESDNIDVRSFLGVLLDNMAQRLTSPSAPLTNSQIQADSHAD